MGLRECITYLPMWNTDREYMDFVSNSRLGCCREVVYKMSKLVIYCKV